MKRTTQVTDGPAMQKICNGLLRSRKFPCWVTWSDEKPKTNAQRNWFHKLCRDFAGEVGLTEGQVKTICKAHKYGTKPAMIGGVTVVVDDSPSTENYSREDYSDLIEICYRLAAEAGVVLPPAEA